MTEVPVSVICAVKYNPHYFIKCLKMWEIQTHDNFEFIVVNDGGSTEFSSILDKSEIKNKKYLHVENQQDRPPAVSWNYGYKHCDGEYIIFLCGDVIVSSKEAIKQFLLHNDDKIRQSVLTYFLSNAMTILLDSVDWVSDHTEIQRLPMFWEYKLPHHNTLNRQNLGAGLTSYITGVPRKLWEYIGGFRNENHHLVSDQDLHLRERQLGLGCSTLPDVVAYHQYHKSSKVIMGTSYIYKNEKQARLLEPAQREN